MLKDGGNVSVVFLFFLHTIGNCNSLGLKVSSHE